MWLCHEEAKSNPDNARELGEIELLTASPPPDFAVRVGGAPAGVRYAMYVKWRMLKKWLRFLTTLRARGFSSGNADASYVVFLGVEKIS